jgi:hypothetical protein
VRQAKILAEEEAMLKRQAEIAERLAHREALDAARKAEPAKALARMEEAEKQRREAKERWEREKRKKVCRMLETMFLSCMVRISITYPRCGWAGEGNSVFVRLLFLSSHS